MHYSSTSRFLVVILLLIVQGTARGHSKTVTYGVRSYDLLAHCAFNFNGYEYDLCRLVGSPRAVDVVVPEIVLKADGTRGEESNSGRGDYILMLGDGDMYNANAAVRFPTWCQASRGICADLPCYARTLTGTPVVKMVGCVSHVSSEHTPVVRV